jgi:hypothetical protein
VEERYIAVVSGHTRGASILGYRANTSKLGLSEGGVAGNSMRKCQPSDLELHKKRARHSVLAVAEIRTPTWDERT